MRGLDSVGLQYGPMVDLYEDDSGPSGSINTRKLST
jgi:hypothetical protein